jgi:hypothetical protein
MQAAAARPGRQRSGVSQFLQHVAAGDMAAFDADGAIPEGDEEEDAASDAGLSDVEVRADHRPPTLCMKQSAAVAGKSGTLSSSDDGRH